MAEVSKVAGPGIYLGRSAELPLDVLPISVRSPLAQDFKHPLTTLADEGKGCFGTEGEEDLLLANSELIVEAVSSILRDLDLRRAPVEIFLALSFQGVAIVRSDAFICFSYL